MNIFRISLFFILVFVLGSGLFLAREPIYDLTIERTALDSPNVSHQDGIYRISLASAKNIWYLGIDKSLFSGDDQPDDICVLWNDGQKSSRECLDMDGEDDTDQYYSFPVETSATTTVAFSLDGGQRFDTNDITLYSLNTQSHGDRLAFHMPRMLADSTVISRAGWGADETLRYTDNPNQQANWKAYLDYNARPKTESELAAIKLQDDIQAFLKKREGDLYQTVSLTRYENGHELVWPIEKVKKVDRIVIHHTAESIKPGISDEAMIRGIYAYHAVSRGWGDIGYNYLIGQDGKIYEGRAGGDYVVGAHALYNNYGSVGISVLGDYEKSTLTENQKQGLKNAIAMVAQKYGITLSDTVEGYRKCTTKDCFPLEVLRVPALMGHRDVGFTSCPGQNLYTLLPNFRAELNRFYSPILNMNPGHIDPLPSTEILNREKIKPVAPGNALTVSSEDSINSSLLTGAFLGSGGSLGVSVSGNTQASGAVRSEVSPKKYIGKKFRVRLSYPYSSISLKSYDGTVANAYLDYKRKPIYPENTVTLAPLGNDQLSLKIGNFSYTVTNFSFSAGAVEIPLWTRIPSWDVSGNYNDNVFRDTIEVYNDNGKLAVINHLPIEWYLKGMGEVSNNDNPEKIKTIVVAARTYADYYMDRDNRKFNTLRYDGSDDPDQFQKYLGYSYELRSPKVAKLVDETEGKKIYYDGVRIKPWYFSVSDGRTLSALEYCQKQSGKNCGDVPYLQSVDDPAGVGKTQSGHGVGISGIGASYFADKGWDYKTIITYYLTGVEIR